MIARSIMMAKFLAAGSMAESMAGSTSIMAG